MRVFSNLAVSLDGKIADRRVPGRALGTPLDRKVMDVLRKQAQVIVFGANTLRAHPHSMRIRGKSTRPLKQPVNAVVTASGKLDPGLDWWNDNEIVRFVFTTEAGYDSAVAAAQERAFVVKAGAERVEVALILQRFRQSGLNAILVEGGGELMFDFLRARYLQELYVTLTPWLLGGRENPTLVGGEGLNDWAALKLLRTKKVKDEIYLHYRVKGALRV